MVMKTERTTGLENLLAHAGWLRRFALALSKDADEAEDLVQETMVASWQHPVEPLERAWLARVARNLMLNRLRGSRRRGTRERDTEPLRAMQVSTPEELIAGAQIHRTVAEVVAGLAEPFRQTLFLRFYEGLSCAEIARELRVPDGTIRWRIKEGLTRVRRELDIRHGNDRSAWMALLAPLIPRPGSGEPTSQARPIHQVPTVGMRLALATLGVSLLSLIILAWLAHIRRELPRPMVHQASVLPAALDLPMAHQSSLRGSLPREDITAPEESPAVPPGPASADAQSLADELLQAVRDNDYDGFVAKGSAFFRAALPTGVFAGLNSKVGTPLERGYRVFPLGDVRRPGIIDWLFKIEFVDGNDDRLLTLVMDGWQVAGFYFDDPNAWIGDKSP